MAKRKTDESAVAVNPDVPVQVLIRAKAVRVVDGQEQFNWIEYPANATPEEIQEMAEASFQS